jgi:glyoxylase-like metal-dependent hydrolase (beta-lactamase superfamily II)
VIQAFLPVLQFTIMLEDDFTYVLLKALRGHALTPGEVALRAGIPESEILAFSRGNFSADTARSIAPVLGLNPDAFANHDHYLPKPQPLPFIHRLDLPFGEERVNAWLVWTDDTAILFDTGYESTSCAVALDAIGAPPLHQIFVTHSHVDHIGGVQAFMMRGNILHGAGIDNALAMKPGDSIQCGSLTVRACDLSGHANPALGFHIEGLARPVLVTGDALFAGSIGGCATPIVYQHALKRLRETLTPLSGSTILLPGHGPGTTLDEEWVNNPFL